MIYIAGIKWVNNNDARLTSDQQFNNTRYPPTLTPPLMQEK